MLKLIKLDKLKKAEWNPKKDDNSLLEKLINSIEYQQSAGVLLVRPISNDIYEIIDGNHRYEALKKMGVEQVWCEVIETKDIVVFFLQRNSQWFEIEWDKVITLMEEGKEEESKILLDTTPLTPKDLMVLLSEPIPIESTEEKPEISYTIKIPVEIFSKIPSPASKTIEKELIDFVHQNFTPTPKKLLQKGAET